jgi:hypothetical protein
MNNLILPLTLSGWDSDADPRYGSLIAAFAGMFARDVANGFRLTSCAAPECRRLMRVRLERTRYCSVQCRWNAAQKAHRRELRKGASIA